MNKDERSQDSVVQDSARVVKRYKVTISGESYFLVSDEPEEHVRTIAHFVDEQMLSLKRQGHTDDPTRQAVLVALQCASKMVSSARAVEQCKQGIEVLVDSVAKTIEQLDAVQE